ncbi:MAG: hypothetical protein GY913_26075 [Proteobacteria bacterium]|nr:hypothetical protein [Pseudomonadota bacterium]MCP4920384.1 hypothetical protein [Pseudomonadota bacterium]
MVATQNPGEFVATGDLSEALLDRFELIRLEHQDAAAERAIVTARARCAPGPELVARAVELVDERADVAGILAKLAEKKPAADE